jgi:hypothetical protein
MGDMVSMVCGKCGIEFHVPLAWYEAKKDGNTEEERAFTCPNGHWRALRRLEPNWLKSELNRAKQEHARLEEARLKPPRLTAPKGQVVKATKEVRPPHRRGKSANED